MLTLRIGARKLITGGDFSCRVNIKNPAWRFKEIPGPLTAEITLPAADNAALLNHPNLVTRRGQQNDRHFPGAVLEHNGIPIIAGNFVITDALKEINGWIQSHVGKLGEELREKSIRELSILPQQTFTNKTTFDPDTDFWCTIKVLNRGFWKDKGKMSDTNGEIEELTAKFENAASFFVNQDSSLGVLTSAAADGVVVVSPFPFVHRLIDQILRENQFYFSDNFLKNDADLKTMCMYHNWSIVVDTPVTELGTFNLFHFFLNQPEELSLEAISNSTWGLGPFNIPDLLPDIALKDLLLGIQNMANVFLVINNNRTAQLIDREGIFSMTPFDLSKYRASKWQLGERKDVTLKFKWDHDDNDSAFKDEFTNLDEKRKKILDPVSSKSELYSLLLPKSKGDIRLVLSENKYYEYGWHTFVQSDANGEETDVDALGWKPVSVGMQNYFFNDGDKDMEEIDTPFSTLRMATAGYPVVYQKGNTKTFSSVNEKFTPRLLFYNGNNTGGDESASGIKLDWKGDNGILRKRWRLTAPFLANVLPISAHFRVPTNVLKYIIDNVYSLFEDSECRFVIDEFDAEPGPNDETLCEIKAYKIEDNFWEYNPGAVIGGGVGTQTSFTPKFVGINKYGKPYLIDATGNYRSTSVFGALSGSDYAHTCCVDYDATNHQLFVGGDSGFVHIYDLANNFRMSSIRVFSTNDSVSCIRVLGNNIFVGRGNSNYFYVKPVQANVSDYTDYSVTAVQMPGGYVATDFVLADGYYYVCTRAGEIFRSNMPTSGFTEQMDVDAYFTRMAVTDTRIYVFERGDRPFFAFRSNPTFWIEFRMTGSDEPCIIEAVGSGGQVVAITNEYTNNVFIVNGPSDAYQTRYGIGAFAKGVLYDDSDIYVCGELVPTETGSLYKFNETYFEYQFNLPEGMKILLY
jgi:hypothetical protein